MLRPKNTSRFDRPVTAASRARQPQAHSGRPAGARIPGLTVTQRVAWPVPPPGRGGLTPVDPVRVTSRTTGSSIWNLALGYHTNSMISYATGYDILFFSFRPAEGRDTT